VLEDPDGLPPVILCYKLNGNWLNSLRGGPVRVVVPEAYGFKSIKWVNRVVLSNLAYANDTYAEQNNDIDSPLKTFAATLVVPQQVKAGQPISVSGYAQVGVSGLSKVQISIQPEDAPNDSRFSTTPWVDATLVEYPENWTALPGGKIPEGTSGFNQSGEPRSWPLPLTKAHWAVVLPALLAGEYILRCRTIDAKGHAQPMPRPFQKSGHVAIESIAISVKE
jgi:hypothetical protein